MHTFYIPQDLEINQIYTLPQEESYHLHTVLRLTEEKEIKILNGLGSSYMGIIQNSHKKKSTVLIQKNIKTSTSSSQLHLIVSPTKMMDRMEYMVEKCTELGVASIQFVQCFHSERKILKLDKLIKKSISALKQSGNLYLPEIYDLKKISECTENLDPNSSYVAHCNDTLKRSSINNLKFDTKTTILIGPEGDFSTDEINLLTNKGIKSIELGKNRLRTETAALYVSSIAYFCTN